MFTKFSVFLAATAATLVSAATLASSVPASAASTVAGPAPLAVSHARISGTGSSWAANAINQWVADEARAGEQVVYTTNGSAQGRQDFAYDNNDFAVSDLGFQGIDPKSGVSDTPGDRQFTYVPIVAGGTAFPYQVNVDGKRLTDLRLSGETLAKIFTNVITNWNDPEITSDNNGRQLPSIPIVPVVHSEGTGATAHLTEYFAAQYPALWSKFNGGSDSATEYFPAAGNQIAATGSDGVINYVTSHSAQGSIAYDEYSYPRSVNYPVVKVENAAGYYTLPTQFNVAVALTKASINDDPSSVNYLQQDLGGVFTNSDPRAYPLSSYSYAIIPTSPTDGTMTTAKRQTLADFLTYSVCSGQSEAGNLGYSALPENLVSAAFDQIKKLHDADPAVDVSHAVLSACNNPTFDSSDPSRNHLAEIAPLPAGCDKAGAGPCVNASPPSPSPTPTPIQIPVPTVSPLVIGTHTYNLSGSGSTSGGGQLSLSGRETLTVTPSGRLSGLGVVYNTPLKFTFAGSIPVVAKLGLVQGPVTGVISAGFWSLSSTLRVSILSLTVGPVNLSPAPGSACTAAPRSPFLPYPIGASGSGAGSVNSFTASLGFGDFANCGPWTDFIDEALGHRHADLSVQLTQVN